MEQQVQQNDNLQQSSLISWYFMDGKGQWVPYPDQVQLCVEDCYQTYKQNNNSKSIVECLMANRNYKIDVKELTQRNSKTGMTRKITRIGDGVQDVEFQQQQRQQQQQQQASFIQNKQKWQFSGDNGWSDYDNQSQQLLAKSYQKYKEAPNNENTNIILSIHYHQYKINFAQMAQINTKYLTSRPIRVLQFNDEQQQQQQN